MVSTKLRSLLIVYNYNLHIYYFAGVIVNNQALCEVALEEEEEETLVVNGIVTVGAV